MNNTKVQDCQIIFDEQHDILSNKSVFRHNTYNGYPISCANNPRTIGPFIGDYIVANNKYANNEFIINNCIFSATLRPILVRQGRSANNIILTNGQFEFSIPTHDYIEHLSEGKAIDNLGSLKGNWMFKKRGANTLLVYLG